LGNNSSLKKGKKTISQKRFTFERLIDFLRDQIKTFPDLRTGDNCTYKVEDAGLGAFSIFFTQFESFLSFQKSMEVSDGISNAKTLFKMGDIPTDNHVRNLLDVVFPDHVYPLFPFILEGLSKLGIMKQYRSINNTLLIAIDGSEYFSSQKIHCDKCSQKKHKNGKITYSHAALTPVIVAPGNNRVISLQPEFITPQDGHVKQDCENTAAKRWLEEYGDYYSNYRATILGDDLYCKQPLCCLILEKGFDFILVCKPDSHKYLYKWVDEQNNAGRVIETVKKRWTGKRHEIDTYRFINQVPLKDGDDALLVNWCELTTTLKDGKKIYKNAFSTDIVITEENVEEIVKCGRARWKIENENNNVLKKQGYNLEHNFGHGKQYLASLLLTLNLLAFLFHTVLWYLDNNYKKIRETLPRRTTFFDDIRALTRYICFENWNALMKFMMKGLKLEFQDTS